MAAMASVRTPDPNPGWLSEIALDETRSRVPILYVEAVPVRVDALGQVEHVGVLLRGSATTGELTRTLVSGRVMHGESVREALLRNLEKDLGPTAFPQLPASTVPFTVAEYFPLPGVTPLHDPRQHAVALVVRRAGHRRVQPAPGRARAHLAHARRRPRARRSSTTSRAAAARCSSRHSRPSAPCLADSAGAQPTGRARGDAARPRRRACPRA